MNLSLTQQVESADLGTQQRVWLALNPGVLASLAAEHNVTPTFVADVFKRRRNSRGGSIERRLGELGAPGFVGSDPE